MRPKEFVARVLDLFEFDMGGFGDIRPKTFSAAALAIGMGDSGGPDAVHVREIAGYKFHLETQGALGHTVIRATMIMEDCILGGAICFTFQDYDTMPARDDVPIHEHIFESWQVPSHLKERTDDIMSMLTFLTLKTDYKIKHKSFH